MSHSSRSLPRKNDPYLIGAMLRHSRSVVAAFCVITLGTILYVAGNFAIDTDLTRMMSPDLPFRRHEEELRKSFPHLSDTVVIVIEADTAERAVVARKRLAAGLRGEKLFRDLYEPGGGDYFEKNGLLYLDTDELQDLADNLAGVQPLLALLAGDLSLRQLFSVLREAVEREGEEIPQDRVADLFRALSVSLEAVLQGGMRHMSWQELMTGGAAGGDERRQFIVARPVIEPGMLRGAEAALDAIAVEARRLGIDGSQGVRVRLTGDIMLEQENLVVIRSNIGLATLASVVLVGITLAVALKWSLRLVAANLIALIVGFLLTLGFAVAAVGKLNLISVTFGVLYVGLGIDFSLLLSLRYAEHLAAGKGNDEAIIEATTASAKGLFLCAASAAIGFYSFIPTAYAGAADLGVISGTGMFVNLVVTLTLLPALLAVFPAKRAWRGAGRRRSAFRNQVVNLPYRHARSVAVGAALVGIVAAVVAPALTFDYNPLNLYNPKSEPVLTAKELFRSSDTSPWTISVLAGGEDESKALAGRLEKVEVVKRAVMLTDYVPRNQEEKLAIIADMALFIPPPPKDLRVLHERPEQYRESLYAFRDAVGARYLQGGAGPNHEARKLYDLVGRIAQIAGEPGRGEVMSRHLEEALLSNLPVLLERLELSLQAGEVTEADLPSELRAQYVAPTGVRRVQIFPREDISTAGPLERFVKGVQQVAPSATDAPVSIFEAGGAVVASFRQASLYALIAITLFLLVSLRSLRMTLLVLVPFAFAFVLTAASSVAFDIPLNFANIIVLPLLLGLGVDNDIHLVHRYRTEPPESGNLLETSTSRAVVFSTITNVMGFGTLSWMPHRGLASMGVLLTLCMTYLIISTVLVLPAMLELFGARRD